MTHTGYDLWKLFGGIGLFLFAMRELEQSIGQLAGRSFKVFIRDRTNHPVQGIAVGLVVTALLQSSSIVNLLVLAFVGARILTMKRALAVILGSNLGSTVYNWVVVLVGFRFDIQSFALPLLAAGAIGLIFFNKHKKVVLWSRFGFGIALLFIGLSFIKTGMEGAVTTFDLSQLNHYGNYVFVLAGFAFTAVVQSSSTTVVVALSALNTGVISFESALCLVIGSETGTTIKSVLGAAGSEGGKKRVALGNMMINVTSSLTAWIFLTPLIKLITSFAHIHDPLIGLVTFQSTINVMGILLFYPILNPFASMLERLYSSVEERLSVYTSRLLIHDPEEAIRALEKDSRRLLIYLVWLNRKALEIGRGIPNSGAAHDPILPHLAGTGYSESYEIIKRLNGELLDFSLELRNQSLSESEMHRVNMLLQMLQKTMNSAKSVKSIRHDIKQFRESADNTLYGMYQKLREWESGYYDRFSDALDLVPIPPDTLDNLDHVSQLNHDEAIHQIFKLTTESKLNDLDMATLINMFGAIHVAHESLVTSLKMYADLETGS